MSGPKISWVIRSVPVGMKYYEITSERGTLLADGWREANLDTRHIDAVGVGTGENWDTLAGSATRVAEGYLFGSSTMDPGRVLSLPNAYNGFAGIDDTLRATIVDEELEIIEIEVSFEGIAPTLRADFGGDGIVEETLDLLLWQAGYANFPGNATRFEGDADGDGFVSGIDFLIWQQEFGLGYRPPFAAVAEPASVTLALWATWLVALRRGRSELVARPKGISYSHA